MKRWRLSLAATAFVLISSPAAAQNGTKVGLLSCKMGPSIGLIVGSRQHIHCRFTPEAGGAPESYSGSITRIGLDVGFRAGGIMGWAVSRQLKLFRTARLEGITRA